MKQWKENRWVIAAKDRSALAMWTSSRDKATCLVTWEQNTYRGLDDYEPLFCEITVTEKGEDLTDE